EHAIEELDVSVGAVVIQAVAPPDLNVARVGVELSDAGGTGDLLAVDVQNEVPRRARGIAVHDRRDMIDLADTRWRGAAERRPLGAGARRGARTVRGIVDGVGHERRRIGVAVRGVAPEVARDPARGRGLLPDPRGRIQSRGSGWRGAVGLEPGG